MAQQIVTELVIDSDTSGADRYSQAMAGAQQAADTGLQSVTGLNIGFLAMGTGAAAALVGVKGLLDYVVSANRDLADMATTAKQVGLTLTDFQGIQFGGQIKGLSTDQINAGLEKSASLLNDASRNSNSLSKELDANGISVKNSNGQLISENQLLGIAGNLIKNANNPGDQLAIAQMLGFTKEWIPLLEQGAGAISGLSAEAKAAGAVIDDETISKAADFDAQWRKSSVEFSSYMKAAVSDLLPMVDDLIERAAKFAKSFNKADIEDHANAQLNAISNPVGGPDNSETLALKIDITPEAKQSIADIANATTLWGSYVQVLSLFASSKPLGKVGFVDPNSVPGYAASQIVEPSYPSADQMDKAFKNTAQAKQDAADDAAEDAASGPHSVVASKDTANDSVDRAINQLEKHTQQQIADTQAVGLGDAALAQFKAEAAETAAVLANGGKETDAQSDKFQDLQEKAASAADALAKAKVASQIDFNSKTAFLSADDVAIATQLKGIYGNDIPAALGSTEAAAIRTNTAFKGISSAIETNLTSGLTDIVSGTKSVSQGFSDMSSAIIKAIEQMIIKLTIVTPLMNAMQLAAGKSGLNISGLFSSSGSSGVSSVTSGSANFGVTGALYHTGGIVGSEPTAMRYVHPAHFDDAPRFHTGGIAGDEMPIIAKRGEGVFTPGQMSAMGGSASSPNIIINNHTDAKPTVSTNSNGDVTVTLKKMVDGAVGDSLSAGSGMRVLNKQYGVKQFAGQ